MRPIKLNKQVKNLTVKKTCIRTILFVVCVFTVLLYGANRVRTPGEKVLQGLDFYKISTTSRICQTSLLALATKHTIFKCR